MTLLSSLSQGIIPQTSVGLVKELFVPENRVESAKAEAATLPAVSISKVRTYCLCFCSYYGLEPRYTHIVCFCSYCGCEERYNAHSRCSKSTSIYLNMKG